ncbi:MAG: thioredoxin family protein [Candidatus Micrarchaeia archaeon]
MEIKILGSGCPNCKRLEENTALAAKEAGIKAKISKVTEIEKIMEYGVMSTPALVVNGEVLFSGRVPGAHDLKNLLLACEKEQ